MGTLMQNYYRILYHFHTIIKLYQLLAHGRWFSPGTLAAFITKTGRHDKDEILLKVELYTKSQSIYRWGN